MSQTVLLISIYFFTRIQNATEVDATRSLLPDPVSCYLMPLIINFSMNYNGERYKTRDETLNS